MDWRDADLLRTLTVVCTDSSVAGSESLQIFGLRSVESSLPLFLEGSKRK